MSDASLAAEDLSFLPARQPTAVPGFHAYSNQLGVAPGDVVDVRVSNDGPVTCTVVRYIGATVDQNKLIATLPASQAKPQPIHRGSYVHIDRGPEKLNRFSVELWFRALTETGTRGLIAQTRWAAKLIDGNRPVFAIRHGEWHEIVGEPVSPKAWHHLVGTYQMGRLTLFVDGKQMAELSTKIRHDNVGGGAILIGAEFNEDGQACDHFTGDVCAPSLYQSPLDPKHIARRHDEKTLEPAADCIGHWKFDALQGPPYRDTSGQHRHGRSVNYPIRMIAGPGRTEDSDWSTYDPTRDADFGHAVRFMADAIVDCRWPLTTSWRVPDDAGNGQYGIFVRNEAGETRRIDFIVRPNRPTAKLLCLSTTCTRVSYNTEPFDDAAFNYGAYTNHPIYPMLGHILGARRPSTGTTWPTATVNFELGFYAWLDAEKIPYDLYTEWDLEADPSLLDHYAAVAWAGHSEYWTSTRYEAIASFAAHGGHVLSLSGNTAYWRVSVDLRNAATEVRKHNRFAGPGMVCDTTLNSSHWHQMDHQPGATMREAGWPELPLIGSVTAGFTIPPLDGPRTGYNVVRPDHWVFHSPHEVRVDPMLTTDAVGYETDVSVRHMIERFGHALPFYPARDGSTEPGLSQAFDEEWTVLARSSIPDCDLIDFDSRFHKGDMFCDMTIRDVPGKSIIFTTGSVLSSDTLSRDENLGQVVKNVLHRMGIIDR